MKKVDWKRRDIFNMKKVDWKRREGVIVVWLTIFFPLLLLIDKTSARWDPRNRSQEFTSSPPVQLQRLDYHVVMSNGLVNVTLSAPEGMVTKIQYGGINNLLEYRNKEKMRGYWDIMWSDPNNPKNILDELEGTRFRVIEENENQVEVSFTKRWNPRNSYPTPSLNIDKRYIMMRGSPGFYSYAIFKRLKGWPDLDIVEGRIAFKLQANLFHYMALSYDRQRVMPSTYDRKMGKVLAYPEAVQLTNPTNPTLKGEVDDKYQFSCENKDNRVHGWICSDPPVGFWVIVPSDEFRSGGPQKQDLTSHAGPTSLVVFYSAHYAGDPLNLKLRGRKPWKKVFGPVFIYLNSVSPNNANDNYRTLWEDAKEQMLIETRNWPYDFPLSKDFPHADQRGSISGQLLVRDRYMNDGLINASSAYVGLARPGDAGSWQTDTQGYQFWNQTDAEGHFLIKGVRPGNYNLYAWVPGFVGDYKYNVDVNITSGSEISVGDLVYEPPRNGPTIWEIGIPDRSAVEFYIPDPDESVKTRLYLNHSEKFRQYGLWGRYGELYPKKDLVYEVGHSNYKTDWFFAHVNRMGPNQTQETTTWRIVFDLQNVSTGDYTLHVAFASATGARLKGWINTQNTKRPHFRTSLMGKDNSIARHGIHGLCWLYSFEYLSGYLFQNGRNTIFLEQSGSSTSPFSGFMYDYLRLEGPPDSD